MLQSFFRAMHTAGIFINETVIPDGKIHRFCVQGDEAGSRNGWYLFYGDKIPAGAFGCWKRGIVQNLCIKEQSAMTDGERITCHSTLPQRF